MAGRYVKSLVYLVSFTGVGYALFTVCTQSHSDINTLKSTLPGVEKSPVEYRKREEQYNRVLQLAASSEKPIYRMTKAELEALVKGP